MREIWSDRRRFDLWLRIEILACEAWAALALEHRRTPMVGRTHGIHAEPITFGFKVAGWTAELDRARRRLAGAAAEAATGKLSGAVGTHATVDPEVEEYVCTHLGL